MKKVIIIIFVIVLVGAGLAAWIILKKEKTNQPASQTASQTPDPFEQGFDKEAASADPFADPSGPFYHKVKLATSDDGVHFSDSGKTILEKASVPDAVKLADGTILIYAVDGAQRSNSQIMVARSKDNGETWQTASAQLETDRKSKDGIDPQAVLMPDGRIRLFYIVNPENLPSTKEEKDNVQADFKPINKIYSAVSSDGVNFVEDTGPLYEGEEITDPDVIKIGEDWLAYISKGQKLFLTTAGSDLKFQYKKDIREEGSISKTIEVSSGLYRQFYCKNGISSAETKDGLTFQNEIISLKMSESSIIICDPSPIKVGAKWLMFYKEGPASEKPPAP
ncbi:MAG: sialidase family protein [Candidatus Berkelbacteria bacterium]|nr:sialidase family protein [Candidatus Berkelbacteria bacterium]